VYSTQRTSTGLANKAYSQSDHTFSFKWYRGPERQACANAQCPRAASFSPLEWSKYALQGCRIQCIICSRLKVRAAQEQPLLPLLCLARARPSCLDGRGCHEPVPARVAYCRQQEHQTLI
jgi:hypothetical protein